MDMFAEVVVKKVLKALVKVAELSEESRIDAINEIRKAVHEMSPFKAEPVDCVLWIKCEDVTANDYNPNTVAPPEMKLLEHSIAEDGYTQPVVTWMESGAREVIDGFHRNRVGRESAAVRKRTGGYLPVVTVNGDRTDRGDRIASTIRHNRARGKHRVDSMSDIVVELKRRNWSDEKIGKDLGMDPDEVLRLAQISGLAEMFSDREFSQAWEAADGLEIEEGDRLDIAEEAAPSGVSPLPEVGGLAVGDVPGDSPAPGAAGDRRGGQASPNPATPAEGHATDAPRVASGGRAKSKQPGKKQKGVGGAGGELFGGGEPRLSD